MWRRIQAACLVPFYLLTIAVAPVDLSWGGWQTSSWTMIAVDIALSIGGLLATIGALSDETEAEAAGLGFLLAALTFLFLRDWSPTWHTQPSDLRGRAVLGLLVDYGALVGMFGIRLIVVRKAALARRLAADILAGKGTKHGSN